jgi:outer membrane immunogenic protein
MICCLTVLLMVLSFTTVHATTDIRTEKGNLFIGGYLQYANDQWTSDPDITSTDMRDYTIKFATGWFLADNIALGLKIGYNRDKSNFSYGTDNLDTSNTAYIFSIGMFMRNYFRLSRNIKFFLETSIVTGFGTQDDKDAAMGLGNIYTTDTFQIEAGFEPGIAFFFYRNLAVELTAGWVGLLYSKVKTDDILDNSSWTHNSTKIDFSQLVDNLKIQIGLAIYL